ncbi:MAG: hypothetical protein JO236_12660 [Mycobacterium sp.]|nr:hypothetical protein [Mycobacterium sp.]
MCPYNLWQVRVTPEQITAERDACQWFNAQYGTLMGQVFGFQHYLADHQDLWTVPGVQAAGGTVKANLDQSAAFLNSRVHTLYVTNYPDQSQYSPLYNGDSFYHLWFQFTQISDKINQKPACATAPSAWRHRACAKGENLAKFSPSLHTQRARPRAPPTHRRACAQGRKKSPPRHTR